MECMRLNTLLLPDKGASLFGTRLNRACFFKRAAKALFALTVVTLLSLWPARLAAQVDTGGLTGVVTDTTGAIIPGAAVTITNKDSGIVSKTVTTSTGQYVFSAIAPGTYTLQVVLPGFDTFTANNIAIHIQGVPTLNVSLRPGSLKQVVTVTDATPLMQAESAEVKQTITGEIVNNMPLASRNWTTLGQVAAGVTTTAGGNTSSSYYAVNGQSFNQNDFRLDGIDNNIEMFPSSVHSTNAAALPPPDAIQEFALQNGDFSAEFGHSVGGVVNAVMKSGTNRLHGDAWDYIRNDDFNANDFFSNLHNKPKAEYRQNIFGATVGGPVWIPKIYNGRNRTFFFFDYQGQRLVTPSQTTSTVPTAGMVASNFTNLQDVMNFNQGNNQTDGLGRVFPYATIFDPATTRVVAPGVTDPYSCLQNTSSSPVSVRDPFYTGGSLCGITNFTGLRSQLNQVPANREDPNAIALLKLYPAATTAGIYSHNYFQNARQTYNVDQVDLRIDEQINDHNSAFVVYSKSNSTQFIPNALPGIADGGQYQNGYTKYPLYEIAGGYVHIFKPTLINDFHVGFNHVYEDLNSAEADMLNLPEQFGITGVPQFAGNGGLPLISIGGLSTIGTDEYTPTDHLLKALQLNDTITWTHAAHNLKFGYEIVKIEGTALQPYAPRGAYGFTGSYTDIPSQNTGLTGVSDILIVPQASTVGGTSNVGGPYNYAGSVYYTSDYGRYYHGAFVQDDWKATSRLTLNLGVRWDYFTPYAEQNGEQANFNPNNGNGPGGTYYLPQKTCNYPRSATFNMLLAKDNINVACVSGLSLGHAQRDNFAPRVGFAFQATPRFVIRGGYGIAYGALAPLGTSSTLGQNYPFDYTISFSNTDPTAPLVNASGQTATLENAIASMGIDNPANASASGVSLVGRVYNFSTPYTETQNLTLQFAATKNSTASIGYVGVLGRHLDGVESTNAATQIVAPGASIKNYVSFPDFATNSTFETTEGSSNYNSLQAVYQLRASSGDSLLANYTYSKCMTDANQFQAGVGYRAPWLPGFGIAGDTQLCSSDATHVAHITGTYHLPFGRGRLIGGSSNAFVNEVIGGWIVNGILTYQSGSPFTVGCSTSTTAFFGCNANKTGQPLYAGRHDYTQWANPAAFTNPPVATATVATVASLGGEAGQLRGPSYTNLDASLFKQFQIRDALKVEVRAEAFNALNHPQFANPSSTNFANTSTFGQITSLRGLSPGGRVVQLAGKIYF